MRNADDHHSHGRTRARFGVATLLLVIGMAAIFAVARADMKKAPPQNMVRATKQNWSAAVESNARSMFSEGQSIFRFDTFGDEVFWTDTLKLHQAIEGSKFGGVGGGVSPKTALSVGLKVDAAALPAAVVDGIKKGKVDLDDPATTLTLIKLNAVVGVQGKLNAEV